MKAYHLPDFLRARIAPLLYGIDPGCTMNEEAYSFYKDGPDYQNGKPLPTPITTTNKAEDMALRHGWFMVTPGCEAEVKMLLKMGLSKWYEDENGDMWDSDPEGAGNSSFIYDIHNNSVKFWEPER